MNHLDTRHETIRFIAENISRALHKIEAKDEPLSKHWKKIQTSHITTSDGVEVGRKWLSFTTGGNID